MSVAIKTAMVAAFILVAIAFIAPLIAQLVPALAPAVSGLSSAVITLAPYLKTGRELLNLIFGAPVIVDVIIWSELVLWVLVSIGSIAVKSAGMLVDKT